MGNFDSMRVSIGVADDVRPGESVEDGYARVLKFVEGKLMEQVDEVEAEIRQLTKGE
jgi:hypothetical protein